MSTTTSFRFWILTQSAQSRSADQRWAAWIPALENPPAPWNDSRFGDGDARVAPVYASTKEEAIAKLRAAFVETAIDVLWGRHLFGGQHIPWTINNQSVDPAAPITVPSGCSAELMSVEMNESRCSADQVNCGIGWLAYPWVSKRLLLNPDSEYTVARSWEDQFAGEGVKLFNFVSSYHDTGYPWPGEYDRYPWMLCQEPCYKILHEDGTIAPSPIHLCRYSWRRTARRFPAWIVLGPNIPGDAGPGTAVGWTGVQHAQCCPGILHLPCRTINVAAGQLSPDITPPHWEHTPSIKGRLWQLYTAQTVNDPDHCVLGPEPTHENALPNPRITIGVQTTETTVTLDFYFSYSDAQWIRDHWDVYWSAPRFIYDKYALEPSSQQVTRFAEIGDCGLSYSPSASPSTSVSPSTSASPSRSPSPSGYIFSQSPSPSPSPSQEVPLVEPGMVMVGQTYNVMLYRVDPIETDICVASANVGSSNWQNPSDRFDVLGDGVVDARDYQALQSYANSHGYGPLPTQRPNGQPYVDVNGDGNLSSVDLEQLATFLETGNVFDNREGRCFPVNDFTVFYDIIDPARVEKVLNGAAIIGAYPRDLYYPVWIDCPTRSFSLADYHDEVPWQTHLAFVHKTLVIPPHEYRRGCRTDPILDSAFWPRLLERICSRLRIPEVSPSPLPPMSVPPATILPVIGVNIRIALLAIYDEADEYYVGSYPFYAIADRITSAGREKFVEDRTYWEQTICLVEERFDHLVRVRMGIAQPVRNKEVSGQWEIKCDRCEMPGDSDRISIDYLRIPAPSWPEKYRVPRITAAEILALFDGLTTTAYGEAPWDPDFLLCILDNSGSIRIADYSDELSTVKEELASRYPTLRIRPDVVTGKPERWLRVAAESLRTLLRIPLEATPLECLPPEQRQYASLSASPSPCMSPSPSPSPEPGDGHENDCDGRGWQPGAWYHPLTIIDFGTLPRGTGLGYATVNNGVKTGYKRAVNIKNTGTRAGSGGCITDTPPFYQNWTYLDLAVGETKPLEVIVDTSTPGEYTVDMVWYCGVRYGWPDPGPGPNGDPVRCHVIIA